MSPVWKTATSNLKDVTVQNKIPYTSEVVGMRNTMSNNLQLALDFRTPKPVIGCFFGGKRVKVLETNVLSSKSIVESRVHCSHNADIIKPTYVAQSILSVDCSGEVSTAESEYACEKRITEKNQPSAEGCIMEVITQEFGRVNDSSVAEKKLASAKNCMNGITTTTSDLVPESLTVVNKLNSTEECTSQRSRVSQKKKKSEAFLNNNCLQDPLKDIVPHPEELVKTTSNNDHKLKLVDLLIQRTKCLLNSSTDISWPLVICRFVSYSFIFKLFSKEVILETSKRMKTKQSTDTSDIIVKVMDYHSRGTLESLTVSDLKSFLATNRAKAGGKKEELIQRITSLLA